MTGTVLLIDGSADRRRALRSALESRGHVVTGEAGSVPEVVQAVAALQHAPSTVLVGSGLETADRIASLLKRTWPKATVIQETPVEAARRRRLRRDLLAAGA